MKILLLFFTFFSGALGAGLLYSPKSPSYAPSYGSGDVYEKLVFLPRSSCSIESGADISDEDYRYYADSCFVHDGKWIKFKMPAN